MKRIVLLFCTGLAACAGQTEPVAQPSPAELEVRAVVDGMFDAMRASDSTRLRAFLHPDARLMTAGEQDGVAMLQQAPIGPFVQSVGSQPAGMYDERISNVEINVDGRLATAWMDYSFYLDEQFSHCGVNAFQLFRTGDGWKVFQITDTRRREGCG